MHNAVLEAHLFSLQDSLQVNEMAEYGAEGEVTQRRLGVKEQQNGELTGKNRHIDEQHIKPVLKYMVIISISLQIYH